MYVDNKLSIKSNRFMTNICFMGVLKVAWNKHKWCVLFAAFWWFFFTKRIYFNKTSNMGLIALFICLNKTRWQEWIGSPSSFCSNNNKCLIFRLTMAEIQRKAIASSFLSTNWFKLLILFSVDCQVAYMCK